MSNEMKTNLSTFVGAGVCKERCCLLFADSGVLDGAMGANVADLVALVTSSSVDNGCNGCGRRQGMFWCVGCKGRRRAQWEASCSGSDRRCGQKGAERGSWCGPPG